MFHPCVHFFKPREALNIPFGFRVLGPFTVNNLQIFLSSSRLSLRRLLLVNLMTISDSVIQKLGNSDIPSSFSLVEKLLKHLGVSHIVGGIVGLFSLVIAPLPLMKCYDYIVRKF